MTEDSTHLKPRNIEDLSASWAVNWVKNFHQLRIRPNMKYGHNPALCWVIAVSIGHLTLDLLGIKCHGIITSSNWTFAWNCFIIAARVLALQPKMCFFLRSQWLWLTKCTRFTFEAKWVRVPNLKKCTCTHDASERLHSRGRERAKDKPETYEADMEARWPLTATSSVKSRSGLTSSPNSCQNPNSHFPVDACCVCVRASFNSEAFKLWILMRSRLRY